MPARACLGGAVHDQNKPMQNRLPALICIEQELTSNGEETPNTIFTWTVSVIGYEKDSQQENSYHHHRDSVPNCTTFSVMFSCFHKLNLFCVKSSNTNSFLIHKPWEIGLKLLGRLDHDTIFWSVPVCRTKCPILAVWCVSTTQKGP